MVRKTRELPVVDHLTIEMPDLKPCPFCGGSAEMDYYCSADHTDNFCVRCQGKGCYMGASPGAWWGTREDAVMVWNTRDTRNLAIIRQAIEQIKHCERDRIIIETLEEALCSSE